MLKRILLLLLIAIVILAGIITYKTVTFQSKQVKVPESEHVKITYDSSALARLSKAIQFKTVSYDEPGKTDYAPFDSLKQHLIVSYPLVHKTLERTVIHNHSLLYFWKGKNTELKPVLFYAHQDVVPVEEVNLAEWKHAPFGGEVHDGHLWGRGRLDDKNSILGIMEATERLLASGYEPERGMYFIFGHDEEIAGMEGAAYVARYLEEKKVTPEFYLDEGGLISEGIVPNMTGAVALIGTAEKGYMTVEVSVKMKGGHSSRPPKKHALGTLVKALAKLEDYSYERKTSETVSDFIQHIGPELKFPLKSVFANQWLLDGVILNEYQKGIEGNAMIRTTGATTVLHAGVKENLIPSEAKAKVNFRILQGETSAGVLKKIHEVIDNDTVVVKTIGTVFEPSPNSSSTGFGWKILQKTTAQVYPDAVVAPLLMLGGTDSRHFYNLTKDVYRFMPTRMTGEQLATLHGVNERIKVDDYMGMITFYETLIKNLNK